MVKIKASGFKQSKPKIIRNTEFGYFLDMGYHSCVLESLIDIT